MTWVLGVAVGLLGLGVLLIGLVRAAARYSPDEADAAMVTEAEPEDGHQALGPAFGDVGDDG